MLKKAILQLSSGNEGEVMGHHNQGTRLQSLKTISRKERLGKKTFKVAGIQYLAKSGMCIFKKINTSNSGISTCNYGIIKLVPYE